MQHVETQANIRNIKVQSKTNVKNNLLTANTIVYNFPRFRVNEFFYMPNFAKNVDL